MCPRDQTDEKPDDATDSSGGAEAAKEQNVVGPLTDHELRAGGMKRTVAYIRSERSKDALSLCARLARFVLRIHKVRHFDNDP